MARKVAKAPKLIKSAFKSKTRARSNGSYGELDEEGRPFNAPAKKKNKSKDWLHSDAKICSGVQYKLEYLASAEVPFQPDTNAENQKQAIAVAAKMATEHPNGTKAKLNVSSGKMTLFSAQDSGKVIMRHSTARVAFSTVVPQSPTTFCYVALVKGTKLALCHVFQVKTAKYGYELTFTCAQAFDYNYRAWQANQSSELDCSIMQPTIESAVVDSIAASGGSDPADEVGRSVLPGGPPGCQGVALRTAWGENESPYMEVHPPQQQGRGDPGTVEALSGLYVDVCPASEQPGSADAGLYYDIAPCAHNDSFTC